MKSKLELRKALLEIMLQAKQDAYYVDSPLNRDRFNRIADIAAEALDYPTAKQCEIIKAQ